MAKLDCEGFTYILAQRGIHAGRLRRAECLIHSSELAIDYLDSTACDWTPEEIDFFDWVFNVLPVMKERAEMMALQEVMAYEREAKKRAPYAQRLPDFIDRVIDTLSKKMVRRLKAYGT